MTGSASLVSMAALALTALWLNPSLAPRLMQTVHGCHYTCECGPPREFGCEQQYHRHLHMLCLPVRCERREDCERIVAAARRGGRDEVGCIVLGRGANEKQVAGWLKTAASVRGFTGFAVGRTTFWDAVVDYEAGTASRQEATSRIAERYREWAAIFDRARTSSADAA